MPSENVAGGGGAVRPMLVLYGSQTGCAQEVAERIAWEGKRRLFSVRLAGMDEYDVMNLPSETLVVMCASTTGQGDAPDNMRSFWSFLLRKSLGADSLAGTSFAVFGLGDSSYAKYNAVAKRLDKRLAMLGAQQLVPLGLGDDQARAGYDQALDPWLSSLWEAALALMPLPAGVALDMSETLPPPRYLVTQVLPPATPVPATTRYSHDGTGKADAPSSRRPFMAKIVKNERLTGENSDKEVRHFELDLEGSGIRYRAGDIVAVQPRNGDEQVSDMAQLCNLDLKAHVLLAPNTPAMEQSQTEAGRGGGETVAEPVCGWGLVTVRQVLTCHLDFMATPRRRFFQLLSFFCSDPIQKERLEELCSKEGRVDLYNYCHKVGRSAYEVLRDFPAARPGLEYLMELIPALRPRLFSISSGPSSVTNRLTITAGIVEYKSRSLLDRKGVCTSFLKAQGDQAPQLGVRPDEVGRVPIWLKPGSLRLPKSRNLAPSSFQAPRDGQEELDEYMAAQVAELDTPLILVGPGTGLAPLRAYLQERSWVRRWLAARGRSIPGSQDLLFFGCRTQESDFLYRQELEALVTSKDLMHLGVAFSRDQAKKVYVQDKVREASALVWQALENGGVIMVSGSSEKMPQDVREAFLSVVEQQAQQGREYAEEYIKRLETQRRYLQDTWS